MTASLILRALQHQGQRHPARLALDDGQQSLTYRGLLESVRVQSEELRQSGSRTVALLADNGIEWALTDLAALAAGVTLVPIPPWFTPAQRRHVIEASGADVIVGDGEVADSGRAAAMPTRLLASRQVHSAQGSVQGQGLSEPAQAADVAKVTFTSGSTGRPKGVRLSRATVDAVAERLRQVLADPGIERHLCVMPLATLLENVAGLYVPLMLGATVHLPPVAAVGLTGSSAFDVRRFRKTLDESGAQSLILTPQLLRAFTASVRHDRAGRGGLRFVAVGGARVSEADLEAAAEAGIPAYQGYGLSECASVVALNRPGAHRAGSVGRPLPGVGVTVDAHGEILVRNQCMHGYLGDPPGRTAVVATGDLGHLDDDGFLYVTGRRKNVFITSYGRNVAPEWPEAELLAQPEIAQACVFGEARATNTAIVVPAGAAVTASAIANAVERANAALPDYARVADWIVADEPFSPANGLATATGKPRRQDIEDRYLRASRFATAL